MKKQTAASDDEHVYTKNSPSLAETIKMNLTDHRAEKGRKNKDQDSGRNVG